MKSQFSPIIQSLSAHLKSPEEAYGIINQYIENFDLDTKSLQNATEEDEFPALVRLLTTYLIEIQIPNADNGRPHPITTEILNHLCTIMSKHPILIDIIASNTTVDSIIISFFANNVDDLYVTHRSTEHFFLPLKFLAFIASSKYFKMFVFKSIQLLINVIASLLSHPQLAAWSAALLSNIAFNDQSFNSYIKQSPHLKTIKTNLGELLTSSDNCAILTALSATVAVFPLNADFDLSVRASLKILNDGSLFPIAAHLVADTCIRAAMKGQYNIGADDVFQILPKASPITAMEMLRLLKVLHEQGIVCNRVERIKDLFNYLIDCEEPYVCVAGCSYLSSLLDSQTEMFNDFDNDFDFFIRVLKKILETTSLQATEKIETLIVMLRLIISINDLNEEIIQILINQEESLFMQFMRRIEHNDSFLAVSMFMFLLSCSSHIPQWLVRLQKIILDSQFPLLVVHVMSASSNRKAVADAISVFTILSSGFTTSGNDSLYKDSLVSSLLIVNQKRNEATEALSDRIKSEQRQCEISTRQSRQETSNVLKELHILRDRLNEEQNETRIRGKSISKCSAEIDRLNEELEKANTKIKNMRALKKELINSNGELERLLNESNDQIEKLKRRVKKLENVQSINHELTASNASLTARNNTLLSDNKALEELIAKKKATISQLRHDIGDLEAIVSETHGRTDTAQTNVAQLEQKVDLLKQEKAELMKQLESARDAYDIEIKRGDNLESTAALLKDENFALKARQVDAGKYKEKYQIKKKQLRKKILECERERKKWETAARFCNRVCQVKTQTVKDVYGENVYMNK